MTTTVTKSRTLRDELSRYTDSIAALIPKGYAPERLITAALAAVQADTSGKLAKCDPKSIALSLARIAQWGLDIGLTAHLVPFGLRCTAIADYKGLIQLMHACGARKVEAHVVREGDEFVVEYGLEPKLRHIPGVKRGEVTHAWAIVQLAHGAQLFEVMTAVDIDAIRAKHSMSWKQGTLDDKEWYARKTVIRRIAKYVPLHGRYGAALASALATVEGDEGDGDRAGEADVLMVAGEVKEIAAPEQFHGGAPKLGAGGYGSEDEDGG